MANPDSPIEPVSYEQVEVALRVWCTVAPKRMWRDFIHHSETKQKWSGGGDPFDRFNANHAFAEYLVGKLRQAGWVVMSPEHAPRLPLKRGGPQPSDSAAGTKSD